MLKNLLSVSLLAFLCAFSINELSAQESKEDKKVKETHKVVIVEKVIDENGKVTEKKTIKEGEEAKGYILSIDGEDIEWTEKESEKETTEGKKVIVKKQQSYVIKKRNNDNEEEVIKWSGEGEVPNEIKEMMENGSDHLQKSKSRITIKKTKTDDEVKIEVEMDGDEIPEEVIKMLKDENIFIAEIEEEDDKGNKAQLGVMIEDVHGGVYVSEIVEGTAAEEAGMKEGDVITMIDNTKVSSMEELIETISSRQPGDSIKVTFLREKRQMTKEVVLKERVDNFPIKTWKKVIIEEEEK